MGRRNFSTTVYLDPDQAEKLRLLSKVTKVPQAEWVRQGIDLVLDRHEHPVARVILEREEP